MKKEMFLVLTAILLISTGCSEEEGCYGKHPVIGYWEEHLYDSPYHRSVDIYLHFNSDCSVEILRVYDYSGSNEDVYECANGTYKTKFSNRVSGFDVVKIYDESGDLVGTFDLSSSYSYAEYYASYERAEDPLIWRADISSFHRDNDPPVFSDFCN